LQYQYASSSEGYLSSGNGTLRFRLINLREGYYFALFRGDVDNPVRSGSNTD
jgi:hypothetical protein